MTLKTLIESGLFEVVQAGAGEDREITVPYCCDLLSIAMGRAPEGCAWVTVMGNINTLAVAALADTACIILAEGAALDEAAFRKAGEQEITVLRTERPVFEAALAVWQRQREEEKRQEGEKQQESEKQKGEGRQEENLPES